MFACKEEKILNKPNIYKLLSLLVNITRSLPFVILMVFIIPFTRFLIGSSIGTSASIVPLTLAAIPLMARLVEGALGEVSKGLIEAARAMGARPTQIVLKVLWPESLHVIINAITIVLVNLIGYSAMAGVIGGGGLGDLAVRYGYQRFDVRVMFITVIILIIFVQSIQYIGEKLSLSIKKG
jgi:D-methionine transport system permease protein